MGFREFFSSNNGGGGGGLEADPTRRPEGAHPKIEGLSRSECEAVCAGKYQGVLNRVRGLPSGPKQDSAIDALYQAVTRAIDQLPGQRQDLEDTEDPIRDRLEEFQQRLSDLMVPETDEDE